VWERIEFSSSSGLVLDILEHISVEHFLGSSPQNELLSCIVKREV
jgi:hypothetical protein